MSFNLIIVKEAPYQGRQSHEILEAVMSLALFDIEHRVVFFEAGLTWLLENQQPENQKSLSKQISALPMYGSENIYYCLEHKTSKMRLNETAEAIELKTLASWVLEADKVEVF